MYLIFYILLLWDMYKRYRNSQDILESSIAIGIICCMVGFVVGGMSSSSNVVAEWLWMFWGVVIAYQGIPLVLEDKENLHTNEG
jgi:predicted Co/Zn/Cd cation transporter (cation efflux family)